MSTTENKVIAITGSSSGIGEATAKLLAQKGLWMVLGARRTDRLAAIASEIRDKGGVAEYRALDVTNLEDMQAFVEFAKDKFGRLDVMVNNAGLMPLSRLEALKIDEWNRMIDVNIRGVLHGIAAALPLFKQQHSGQFVNISSTGGHNVYPTAAVYCATKFAVWAISEEVLPYFKKSEHQQRGASEFHGINGALSVTDPIAPAVTSLRFIEAAEQLGYDRNPDFNGAQQEGAGLYQLTIKDGKRHSAAAAFLVPILDRPNLTVQTGAFVTRLLFEGTRTIGVEYLHEGRLSRIVRELFATDLFNEFRGEEVAPGVSVTSDEALQAYVRNVVSTVWHPVGTCKMGTYSMAVVDAQLRVHGIEGLRVVDASIMPTITTGNTNAPTIMIGEKAADLIKTSLQNQR